MFDDDVAGAANLSTGVMTYASDLAAGLNGRPRRKTRIVAAALEAAGRPTRMIEHRLPGGFTARDDMPAIALIGVDNLELRRSLSDMGWRLCIDAGLGSTPSSYNSMSMHVFDGSNSSGMSLRGGIRRRASLILLLLHLMP